MTSVRSNGNWLNRVVNGDQETQPNYKRLKYTSFQQNQSPQTQLGKTKNMVLSVSEDLAHGEVESEPFPPDEPSKTHLLSSLGRQSSIYSLTLDEFQNTICDNGKNFGSMNMDEFLTNIWTAEENQAIHSNHETSQSLQEAPTGEKSLTSQRSLPRQGSLSLPAPLCRKTVEEVWAEIHREQQEKLQQQPNNLENPGTTGNRQPTLGEMTLEDFLIKAGVVREVCTSSSQHHIKTTATLLSLAPATQQYGSYQDNTTSVDPNFGTGPIISLGFSDHQSTGNAVSGGVPAYQTFPPSGAVVGEPPNYAGNGKRNGGFSADIFFGGRTGNGGGHGAGQTLGMGSPVSPVSSDGICPGQVDKSGAGQYGLEMGGMNGRRMIDGPVEKVVERRQQRMIKNRESAARSRARKQAYTVELEAELNHLKEENTRLKLILAEAEKKRKQEMEQEMKDKTPTTAQKNAKKLRSMGRSLSFS